MAVKITIITVCHNAAKTIQQTIESVVEQDYGNIEYIIVDGRSTDDTPAIVSRYKQYVAKYIYEKDDGIYDAMNKGIQAATGDYIQFIGADDCLYDRSTISRVVACMKPGIDIFSAARLSVDEKYLCEVKAGNEKARMNSGDLPWMPHTGVFVKSGLMKKMLFDTHYRIAADMKFLLAAYYDEDILFQYVDFPVAYFSLGGVSMRYKAAAERENQQIFQELHLLQYPYAKQRESFLEKVKDVMRVALDCAGLLGWLRCRFGAWSPHACSHRVCRWCGRSS